MIDFLIAISVCAAIALTIIALWQVPWRRPKAPKKPTAPTRPTAARNRILVDGSNVMYWNNETPKLNTVADVVDALKKKGFAPHVIFDASAGYRISDRYWDDAEFSEILNLPEDRVLVVPKGVTADEYLLSAARDYRVRIVTNDRFRDWQKDFPEVRRKDQLVKGGYRKGKPWLGL